MFWCVCVYFEQGKYRNNESKSEQREIIFLTNYCRLKSAKSEGLGVVGVHVWTVALGDIKHGDKIGVFAW